MVKTIGVVSGKGGVGKTTLAANLALAIKQFGKKVTIVDCNITTPHLNFYLGASGYDLSLNDVLHGSASLRSATYYHQGISFVPASSKIEDLIDVDIMKLKDSLTELDGVTDVVILDSAPALGREAVSVLTASDEIIFVATPSLPAVEDVVKCTKIVEKLNAKILGIVLNMIKNEKHELRSNEVEAIARIPVIAKIPFDRNVLDGLTKRIPILLYKPSSLASIECMKLAANLLGMEYTPREKVFSRLYNTFKKLMGFRPLVSAPSIIPIEPQSKLESFQRTVIETDVDKLLKIINEKGSIAVEESAKILNVNKENIEKLGKILEEHKLIRLGYSPLGRLTLHRWKNEQNFRKI